MSRFYIKLFFVATLAILLACSKKEQLIKSDPIAQFGIYQLVGNPPQYLIDTTSYYNVSTEEEVVLKNLSEGGDDILWDFGDGNTSKEASPKHVYSKSGKYSLSLKITNNSKQNSIKAKTINVTERKLSSIRILSLNFNSGFIDKLNWSIDQRADIYVEIKELQENAYPDYKNGSYSGDLLYKSNILKNVNSRDVPININLDSSKMIRMSKILSGRYGFNIHVVDFNRIDHIISSNWGSGTVLSYHSNIQENKFIIQTQFNGVNVDFECNNK